VKNYFYQLLIAHGFNEVRVTKKKTACSFECEIVIARLIRYETRATDHIPAEMLQAGRNTRILHSEVYNLINFSALQRGSQTD
jgi:hypothetical protein